MGTNYYLESKPPCSCCGRPYEDRHIGKSSVGWCFALHVYPEEGIQDLKDWEPILRADGAVIRDEYGNLYTPYQMLAVIRDRNRGNLTFDFRKIEGEPGPNNLARNHINGCSCIAHGEGTWDCCVGDFF